MNDSETIELIAGVNRQVLSHINSQKGEHQRPQQRPAPHYGVTHPQHQPPQFHHQPPPGFDPQPFGAQPDPYAIPEEVLPVTPNFIPLPRDEKGNEIIPSGYRHLVPTTVPVVTGVGNSQNSFHIPDYTQNNTVSPPNNQLEIILKEIKSLKKSVNKLIREMDRVKLQTETPNMSE